jgi:hypothetical protein
MSEHATNNTLDARLAVEQRIREHPAAREYATWEGLERTFRAVYLANWDELRVLLLAPTTDVELAIELFQNAYRPDVRERFTYQVAQRLHNYLAGTMTLVDHSRRIMRDRTGPTATEFAKRKDELIAHPEIEFFQQLRNYLLHRALPIIGHTVTFNEINTAQQEIRGELELSVAELSGWDEWSARSRAFLAAQGEAVILRELVQRHGELVAGLNAWLLNALAADNADAMAELNRLVAERNGVMLGINQVDAERWTAELTAIRQTPRNEQTTTLEDLMTRGFRVDHGD